MAQRTFLETGWIINMVLETYLKSSGMVGVNPSKIRYLLAMELKWLLNVYLLVIMLVSFNEGNHRIYEIVSQWFYELRIDMSDFAGESRYAVYRRFSIGDENQGFQLLIEDYIGTSGCIAHRSQQMKILIK